MNKLRKFLLCILNTFIGSFLVVGWAACYGGGMIDYPVENKNTRLSGKVVQKGNTTVGISSIKVYDYENGFFTYSGTDGLWSISGTNHCDVDSIIVEDIDGTNNGGLFLTNSSNITLQFDGTSYHQENIIIEMEKSSK
jgi:hypothetical protein